MKNEDTSRERRGNELHTQHPPPEDLNHLHESETDWSYLEAMTGEEAHHNAVADEDNPPLTADQLSRMRRVPNPKKIRLSLKMTQEEFARKFQIALGTLRDWEQGVRRPDSTARAYLYVIEKNPETVQEALASPPLEPALRAGTIGPDEEKARRLA